jgi:predicted RNase H-like HicB family nuclease
MARRRPLRDAVRGLLAGYHLHIFCTGVRADVQLSLRYEMKRDMRAVVWQEDKWFVAQCLDVDVASQGHSGDEALENLRDALELHLAPPAATILPEVRTIELEVAA